MIKYGFIRVTVHILNTPLDNLETNKSICHILGFQKTGCVKKFNSNNKSNVLYPANIISKFSMIFHFCLMRGVYC